MKSCKWCNTERPFEDFHRSSKNPDGLQYKCKPCTKAYAAKRYIENREEILARSSTYSKTPRGREVARAASRRAYNPEYHAQWKRDNRDREQGYKRKRRARARGVFSESYTRLEIWQRDNGTCVHCGTSVPLQEMHLDHLVPLSYPSWWALTLGDSRINIAVSCSSCNLSKNNHRADFSLVLKNMISLQEG